MAASCRVFVCAGCEKIVHICSDCDHGNRYCGDICTQAARCKCVREAGRRYQESPAGAAAHARREKKYRTRQAEFSGKRDASGFTSATASATDAIVVAARPSEANPATAPIPAAPPRATDDMAEPRRVPAQDARLVVTCLASALRERQTRCNFCGRLCDPPVRDDFIRRRGPLPGEELDQG